MTAKTIADVLERVVDIAQSMMDAGRPSDETTECPMCRLKVIEAKEHDPDCGYRIARTRVSPADLAEVRRLIRVLRYDGGVQ